MALVPIITGLASAGISAYAGHKAAGKKAKADKAALEAELAHQEKMFQRGAGISQALQDPTQKAGNRSLEELARGFAQQRAGIERGGQVQLEDIGRTGREQLGFLGRGLAGAETALSPALALQQKVAGSSRLEQLLADPSAITQDPAFQFRQRQGEEALARSAAARGGRAGGRAQKALTEFSQGLASTELDAAARRAEMADAGNRQLAGVGFGAGSQLAGLASQFGQQAGDVAGTSGLQRRGIVGATTDALGQSYASQGQATAGQIGANQAALGNLGLAPFGLTATPGAGVNFQAGTGGAGSGSAALSSLFSDVARAGIETGFKQLGGGGNKP